MTAPHPVLLEAFRGKYSSSVVGLLSCQINSYLKNLTTKVVSCREVLPVASEPKASGKKDKKKNVDTKKETADESPFKAKFEVELEDTILFPEGMVVDCVFLSMIYSHLQKHFKIYFL